MAKFKIIGAKKVAGGNPGDVIEIDDEQVAKTLIKAGHIKPTTIRKKRARKKDDKSTPDINEAWEEVEDNG